MVETERRLGVITEVEVQSRTYLSLNARLDLLVEIEDVVVSRAQRKRRVRDILMFEAEEQLRTSLHLQLHTAGTEHFIGRTDVELHIGDIKFLLVVMLYLADFLLPIPVHQLPLRVLIILVLRQHIRRGDIRVADLRTDDIGTGLRLIFHGCGDIIRVLQVHRTGRGT